ncbi:hypothetical protein AAT19DRAFT_14466 [Rhodotorula toruloides]|uniref:Uncharacterized protein n=1 Tax=Rhodotorula toruloides TaxID=5286 RepID=A0A2T0ABT1_RHOTO|nr:hypothetical protein AAT19DRAFT_14466 [Rhodotorula toruloides]
MPFAFHPLTTRSICSFLTSAPSSLTHSSNATAHGPVPPLPPSSTLLSPSKTSCNFTPPSPANSSCMLGRRLPLAPVLSRLVLIVVICECRILRLLLLRHEPAGDRRLGSPLLPPLLAADSVPRALHGESDVVCCVDEREKRVDARRKREELRRWRRGEFEEGVVRRRRTRRGRIHRESVCYRAPISAHFSPFEASWCRVHLVGKVARADRTATKRSVLRERPASASRSPSKSDPCIPSRSHALHLCHCPPKPKSPDTRSSSPSKQCGSVGPAQRQCTNLIRALVSASEAHGAVRAERE